MDERTSSEVHPTKYATTAERKSERELVVTRTFNGPALIVFDAWTKPELFQRWWVPKSFGAAFLSCEIDARIGGTYRFVFSHPSEFVNLGWPHFDHLNWPHLGQVAVVQGGAGA